jgi:mercuric ion binding protein
MRFQRLLVAASAWALLVSAGAARAETKVELKGVHLCCGQCVKLAGEIVKKVEGATIACDQKKKTVTITADDDKTAQKAVDALAKGGFYGKSDNKEVKIKNDSGAEKGKVSTLTVSGAHNCCGQCCKALKATVAKVEGVTGDTAKPKAKSFEVMGDFDAAELVKALNAAGFHVTVKK